MKSLVILICLFMSLAQAEVATDNYIVNPSTTVKKNTSKRVSKAGAWCTEDGDKLEVVEITRNLKQPNDIYAQDGQDRYWIVNSNRSAELKILKGVFIDEEILSVEFFRIRKDGSFEPQQTLFTDYYPCQSKLMM